MAKTKCVGEQYKPEFIHTELRRDLKKNSKVYLLQIIFLHNVILLACTCMYKWFPTGRGSPSGQLSAKGLDLSICQQ